jgi:methanogenic corrinoid protein MtbC1
LREQVEQGLAISRAVDILERSALELPVEPTLSSSPEQSTLTPEPEGNDISFAKLSSQLLEAFENLNEGQAERIMNQALAAYGIEEFCTRLIEPVMIEIGERWSQNELSVSIEHFASAIIRTELSGLLKNCPQWPEGPLVVAGCAPGEYHEIGLLMVLLFLRRQGLRVLYLGQNVEIKDFIEIARQTHPQLVTLSASTAHSLAGLTEAAQLLNDFPPEERPIFSYGGRLFQLHPELAFKLRGYYLGARATEAVEKIRNLAQHHFVLD